MNVYVESNFVLELALLQEQAASCETLLGLSASDQVNLIVPAYSLAMRRQKENDFSAQDAIAYKSVVNDLRTRPTEHGSCFLNRNSKDFDDQNVVEELANWDCTLFPRFDSGLDFVRSRLD